MPMQWEDVRIGSRLSTRNCAAIDPGIWRRAEKCDLRRDLLLALIARLQIATPPWSLSAIEVSIPTQPKA